MPGMSGRTLAGRLTDVRRGVRVLSMSGYTDDAMVRHGVLEPRHQPRREAVLAGGVRPARAGSSLLRGMRGLPPKLVSGRSGHGAYAQMMGGSAGSSISPRRGGRKTVGLTGTAPCWRFLSAPYISAALAAPSQTSASS